MTGLERLLAAMRDAAEVESLALHRWGVRLQTAVAVEECAEFIQAVSRYTRGRDDMSHVVEEAADAICGLLAAGLAHGNAAEGFTYGTLAAWVEVKTKRLRERIEAAKEGGRG